MEDFKKLILNAINESTETKVVKEDHSGEPDPYETFCDEIGGCLLAHHAATTAGENLENAGAPAMAAQAYQLAGKHLAAGKEIWDAHPEHHSTDTFDGTVHQFGVGHHENQSDWHKMQANDMAN